MCFVCFFSPKTLQPEICIVSWAVAWSMLCYGINLCQSNHTVWRFAGTVFQCWLDYCLLTHVSIPQNLMWSNSTACEPLKNKCYHTLLKTWNNEKKIHSSFILPSFSLIIPSSPTRCWKTIPQCCWFLLEEKVIFGRTTLHNPGADAISLPYLGGRKLQFQARTERAHLILAAELSKRRISDFK